MTIFPIAPKSLILFEIEDPLFCIFISLTQNRDKFFPAYRQAGLAAISSINSMYQKIIKETYCLKIFVTKFLNFERDEGKNFE